MTLIFDNCLGHTSDDHQYHYHLAPKCLLETLYGPDFKFPANASKYWSKSCKGEGCKFPTQGSPSPVVGFALDGFPIYALYDNEGALQTGAGLDKCNGKKDAQGNYGYYITTKAPYFPQCLTGVMGKVTTEISSKPCKPPASKPKVCFKQGSTWVHHAGSSDPTPCSLSDSDTKKSGAGDKGENDKSDKGGAGDKGESDKSGKSGTGGLRIRSPHATIEMGGDVKLSRTGASTLAVDADVTVQGEIDAKSLNIAGLSLDEYTLKIVKALLEKK